MGKSQQTPSCPSCPSIKPSPPSNRNGLHHKMGPRSKAVVVSGRFLHLIVKPQGGHFIPQPGSVASKDVDSMFFFSWRRFMISVHASSHWYTLVVSVAFPPLHIPLLCLRPQECSAAAQPMSPLPPRPTQGHSVNSV